MYPLDFHRLLLGCCSEKVSAMVQSSDYCLGRSLVKDWVQRLEQPMESHWESHLDLCWGYDLVMSLALRRGSGLELHWDPLMDLHLEIC